MSDPNLVTERLERLLTLLNRIPGRFATIYRPADFLATESGLEHLDSICMVLIAVGEEVKKIDRQTSGILLQKYPQIPWSDIMGMRDFLAHRYFEVDPEQLFNTCQQNIPQLIEVVKLMLNEKEF
jgi:uncharacterized protein with HEPN domain